MSKTGVSYAGNKLEIQNPFVVHGIFQLALGGLLLIVFCVFSFSGFEQVPAVFSPEPVSKIYEFKFLRVGLFFISSAVCLVVSVSNLALGCKKVLSFVVPTNLPVGISDSGSIDNFLGNRIIGCFENQSSILVKASKFFSDRFLFMTAPQKRHVENCIVVIGQSLLATTFVLLPIPFKGAIARGIGSDFVYPLPLLCLLVLLIVVIGYLVSLFFLKVSPPEAVVLEERLHVAQANNPNNFFAFLERKLEEIRVGSFQNRFYTAEKPLKNKVDLNESNTINGRLIVENQPVPVRAGCQKAGHSMDAFGLFLCVFGAFILLQQTHDCMSPDKLAAESFSSIIITLWAGVFALTKGGKLMRTAFIQFNLFTYESDLLEVAMDGTYTAANVGMGDGRGGTLHSQRVSIYSEANLLVRGSRVVSYTEGIEGARRIISSRDDEAFRRCLHGLVNSFLQFKDTSGELVGVDVHDPNLNMMLNRNAQIAGQQRAAEATGQRLVFDAAIPERLPEFCTGQAVDGALSTSLGAARMALYFLSGELTGERVSLDGKPFFIGRNPSRCSLVLSHKSVSRVHCQIDLASGGWGIKDIGSSYGTYVDGARIPPGKRYPLHDGRVVSLGKAIEFKFVSSNQDVIY